MNTKPVPTVDQLRRELHWLIDQVAEKPRAAVLLLGLRSQARLFADYKSNRVMRPKPKPRSRVPR